MEAEVRRALKLAHRVGGGGARRAAVADALEREQVCLGARSNNATHFPWAALCFPMEIATAARARRRKLAL
eukprot:SAG11_NODE_5338_length_1590_cov_1.492958_3_plen_71_part_00